MKSLRWKFSASARFFTCCIFFSTSRNTLSVMLKTVSLILKRSRKFLWELCFYSSAYCVKFGGKLEWTCATVTILTFGSVYGDMANIIVWHRWGAPKKTRSSIPFGAFPAQIRAHHLTMTQVESFVAISSPSFYSPFIRSDPCCLMGLKTLTKIMSRKMKTGIGKF